VTEKFFYNEFYIYKNLKKMRYILFFFRCYNFVD